GISRKQREAMKEAMERRVKWIEEMMSKGLQIVVALGSRGGKKGLIEYLPIEMAPEPVKGTHSLFIDCIWVLPPYWERGIARGLMECFLEEAEKVGGATVLAYEADR
ncbi:GNAT family N-acetyltransferase, partial [Candidatus Bathyarchaeota archaeon]|nr:GNAT family N-acetyltransferase [Candidatus Bathyarchaeota archaeon]